MQSLSLLLLLLLKVLLPSTKSVMTNLSLCWMNCMEAARLVVIRPPICHLLRPKKRPVKTLLTMNLKLF